MKIEDTKSDGKSGKIVVVIRNKPSSPVFQRLYETAILLERGKQKKWDNDYTYRVDNRPENMGGDQIHIFGRNKQWAFRHDGSRSELNKYTSPATNTVKEILCPRFSI